MPEMVSAPDAMSGCSFGFDDLQDSGLPAPAYVEPPVYLPAPGSYTTPGSVAPPVVYPPLTVLYAGPPVMRWNGRPTRAPQRRDASWNSERANGRNGEAKASRRSVIAGGK